MTAYNGKSAIHRVKLIQEFIQEFIDALAFLCVLPGRNIGGIIYTHQETVLYSNYSVNSRV